MYNIVVVDGIQELDFLDSPLSTFDFEIKREVQYYRVIDSDLVRPDSIAFKFYAQERFWWLILVANNITDVQADLVTGLLLEIPNILDIYDYVSANRKPR